MKKLNFLAYFFIFVVIYCLFVFTNDNASDIFKYIGFALIAILAIIVAIYFSYLLIQRKQNDKLNKMIEDKKYDEVIDIIKAKETKKHSFYQQDIYDFLLVLAYAYKDDKEKTLECIENLKGKDSYPQVYYYLACYNFLDDKMDELALYHHMFTNSYTYIAHPEAYSNLNKMFRVLCKFKDNKEEALSMLELVDTNSFTIPCSLKAIEKIKKD